MSKKIKFNVSNIFMEGQNTVEDRNLFVTSPLFGIFTALYNRSGGKVKVGKIETDSFYPASGKILFVKRVYVVSQLGLQVCNINNTSVDYNYLHLNVNHTPINSENYVSVAMQTTNPKYLQSKLLPSSTHDAATRFDMSLKRAELFFNTLVRDTMLKSIKEKYGDLSDSSHWKIRSKLSDSVVLFLAKHFMGEVSMSEMRSADRAMFDTAYGQFREIVNKFKISLKDAYDMVSTEKWLYVTNVNGGVLLSAIRPEPMCAALDTLSADETNLPYEYEFNYIQETLPAKWYPDYQAIPEDIRQQLEFSMVMLKAHVGSRVAIFDEMGDHVFNELGSRYFFPGGGTSQFYFLTK